MGMVVILVMRPGQFEHFLFLKALEAVYEIRLL